MKSRGVFFLLRNQRITCGKRRPQNYRNEHQNHQSDNFMHITTTTLWEEKNTHHLHSSEQVLKNNINNYVKRNVFIGNWGNFVLSNGKKKPQIKKSLIFC
jgi:hypothetical protein